MDDFQKATTSELKARFTSLEERNERLNEMTEQDQVELTALKALLEKTKPYLLFANTPISMQLLKEINDLSADDFKMSKDRTTDKSKKDDAFDVLSVKGKHHILERIY